MRGCHLGKPQVFIRPPSAPIIKGICFSRSESFSSAGSIPDASNSSSCSSSSIALWPADWTQFQIVVALRSMPVSLFNRIVAVSNGTNTASRHPNCTTSWLVCWYGFNPNSWSKGTLRTPLQPLRQRPTLRSNWTRPTNVCIFRGLIPLLRRRLWHFGQFDQWVGAEARRTNSWDSNRLAPSLTGSEADRYPE